MSSIKDLFDYDLVKKCYVCKNILLKSNFSRNAKSKDGLQAQCTFCKNDYNKKYYFENRDSALECRKKYKIQNRGKINEHIKNRMKSDLNFKLSHNLRSRTNKAFKSQNVRKTNKTFDLLGCSHSFFKKWIVHQLYGIMTIENYGSVWQIDHCLPITSFNLLDESDMKKCFNWINLRPMYCNENISKGSKIDHRLYLLQQIKAKYFLKINNDQQGLN